MFNGIGFAEFAIILLIGAGSVFITVKAVQALSTLGNLRDAGRQASLAKRELDEFRARLGELEERLDLTERMLQQLRDRELPPPAR